MISPTRAKGASDVRIYDALVDMLRGAEGQPADPNPTLGDLIAQLGNRSFGIVLVLFGLPNLLPVPGLPMICGVVIGVIAWQMVQGNDMLILPQWLANRRLKRDDLARVIAKAEPTMRRIERALRPRFHVLTEAQALRVIGAALLVLAVALMAPIPFFGGIPPGIAVILLGLAVASRDGVFAIIGAMATFVAVAVTGIITWGVLKAVGSLF